MKLTDLYRQHQSWYFTWRPSHPEAFDHELACMKDALNAYGLRWLPDDKVWRVDADDADVEQALCLVFTNARFLLDAIANQLELF